VKDFPKKGINFMDLFSITINPKLFKRIMEAVKTVIEVEIGKPGEAFNIIYGLEARGFVLGPLLALEWNLPFAPIRKKGKLPGDVISFTYDLEYGTDTIEI
jgi:adenine phosphoribosyltransferase